MKAKEYLSQYGQQERLVSSRIAQLKRLREDMSVIRAVDYSKPRVQSSPSPDAALSGVESLVDIEALLERDIVELHRLRYTIVSQIAKVPDLRYQEILTRRYVDRQSLQVIADGMGYSYTAIAHMHGTALAKFQAINLKCTKDYKTF